MKRLITIVLALLIIAGTAWAAEPISARRDGTGRKTDLNAGSSGQLRVEPLAGSAAFLIQESITLETMEATTGWTALNNDTTGLATDLDHVLGTKSLEWDKVDGVANTVFGCAQKTITSVDLSSYVADAGSAHYSLMVSDTVDVAYCFLRLGTSAAHYNEWRVLDNDIQDGWNLLDFPIFEPSSAGTTGNGWNVTAVTYVALGCAFDVETDALADLRVDNLYVISGVKVAQQESSIENPVPNEQIFPIFDDDATANCVAITNASVQFTMPANDAFEICAHGNTAYILCGAAPTATTAVGNYSFQAGDGQCIGVYEFGSAKCAVIGTATAGAICFQALDYH